MSNWHLDRAVEYEANRERLRELMESGEGRYNIAKEMGVSTSMAQRWMNKLLSEGPREAAEMTVHAAKLSKSRQQFMDRNRIREKILREGFRVDNALEAYVGEFNKLLKKNSFTKSTVKHRAGKEKAAAVIQLSDLHFNERISLPHNRYDFRVASARMKLLANKARRYIKAFDVDQVVVAMTGDMLNSDRRLDEMLSQACNRAQASFLAVDILQQFIRDLNRDWNITIGYVTGNESRIQDEIAWTKDAVSDNYDTMVFNMLRMLFKDAPGVSFIEGEDPTELPVTVGGTNFLFTHGMKITTGVERTVEQIQGRYANRNMVINYVAFGHLHAARIGDTYGRSSSLAGSNAYNEGGLNLYGRASQNLYIVHPNGLNDGIKIDLQVNDDDDRYHIDEKLEAYNTKSAAKNARQATVFKVVI